MERDKLCPSGKVFVKDEKYILSRYEIEEQNLFLKTWKETFENSIVLEDEKFKKKSWEEVWSDTTKLHLKIVDNLLHEYIGEVVILQLDSRMPELGIQLLRKYQGQGIGTRIMKLLVNQLKFIMGVESFLIRIRSDNYVSQHMFKGMGAVKIGEEGKEYTELMQKIKNEMGKDKFEEIIGEEFEKTQVYTICYELPVF